MTRFQITIILSVSLTILGVLDVLLSPIPAQETAIDIFAFGFARVLLANHCSSLLWRQ